MRKSQKEIAESSRSITRRGLALGAIQMAVVSVLGLKLRSMQIEHADEYRLLSDGNSIKIELLPPARGLILDRHGTIIAGNEQNYRVTLTREEAGDVSAVIARLRQIIPMSDRQAAEILAEIRKRSAVTPVMVADRLRTGADGSVGLTLRDNTLLSAGPNSLLVVDKFVYDNATQDGRMALSIRKGTLSVASGKIAKRTPESVDFHTPTSILGVRGTEFVIEVEGDGDE